MSTGELVTGASFAATAALVTEHCHRHHDAVVMITGPYGAGHHDLADEVSRALGREGSSAPRTAIVCSSARSGPEDPGRRLDALELLEDTSPDAVADWFCTPGGDRRTVLFVPHADVLDDDSLRVVEVLVHSRRATVVMGAAEPPHRWAGVLRSSRGMIRELGELSASEAQEQARTHTGSVPTAATLDYLLQMSGALRMHLRSVLQLGLAEQWLGTAAGRLVVIRPPTWLDRQWGTRRSERLADLTTVSGMRLLERTAVAGRVPLRMAMADAGLRSEVVRLERLGIIRITEGALSIRHPVLALGIGLGITRNGGLEPAWHDAVTADEPSREALTALAAGVEVDDDELLRGALASYAAGLFDRARAQIAELAAPSEGALIAGAMIEAAAGRPRAALRALHELIRRTGSSSARVTAEYLCALCFSADAPDDARIDPSSLPPAARDIREATGELRRATAVTARLRGRQHSSSPPPMDPAMTVREPEAAAAGVIGTAQAPLLERTGALAPAIGLVVRAYHAALFDRRTEAVEFLARLASADLARLPALGLTWCAERIGLARLLIGPGADPDPAAWLRDVSPTTTVLRSLSMSALGVIAAIVHGHPQSRIHEQLEEAWAHFETQMPAGSISRELMDALDIVVEGPRSTGLIGPANAASAVAPRLSDDPSVTVATAIGRSLRCPPTELPGQLAGDAALSLPSIRRLIVRTVILRRAASLPPPVCAELVEIARAAGVEPAVIALARTRTTEASEDYESARAAMRGAYPELDAPQRSRDAAEALAALDATVITTLTRRERAVATRLVRGESTAAIARDLGIAPRTVETHVNRVYRKLEVHSRTELRAVLVA